jgi:hypothetical protein
MSSGVVTGAFAVGASVVTGGTAWLVARFSGKQAEKIAGDQRLDDATQRVRTQEREAAVRLLVAVDSSLTSLERHNPRFEMATIEAASAELELIAHREVVRAATELLRCMSGCLQISRTRLLTSTRSRTDSSERRRSHDKTWWTRCGLSVRTRTLRSPCRRLQSVRSRISTTTMATAAASVIEKTMLPWRATLRHLLGLDEPS